MKWFSDRWHDFLVLVRLRPDYRNPDNAPPAFWDKEPAHAFKRGEGALVCVQCGGGRLHKVHSGFARSSLAEASAQSAVKAPTYAGEPRTSAADAYNASLVRTPGARQGGLPFPVDQAE